jgi:hypothetical protein
MAAAVQPLAVAAVAVVTSVAAEVAPTWILAARTVVVAVAVHLGTTQRL